MSPPPRRHRPQPCRKQRRHPPRTTLAALMLAPALVLTLALILALAVPCAALSTGPAAPASAAAGPEALFVDRAAETGLDFVHFNGMSGEHYFVETMGAGVALFDYDGDGDLDVLLLQGNMLGPGKTLADATFPPKEPLPLKARLFRNDLVVRPDGSRTLHFTDVTEASRLDAEGYAMGVATGDYDNDGRVDLYLTNFGSNQMWHNNGDGTFTEVTAKTGTDDRRLSVPATFFDYDRDGWLDLYVGNDLDFSYATHKVCNSDTGVADYCGPLSWKPEPDVLFHNRGDGTFEDVTLRAGLDKAYGPALGVVADDLDGDGWPDLYVANDSTNNQLWINQHDGTFRDDALLAGCAVDAEGRPQGSMGVDAGDFDGDGDDDLFMTHVVRETNTLYVDEGGGIFHDGTIEAGLAAPSWAYTAFGTRWLDYDGDGRPDLLTVDGAVNNLEELVLKKDPFPLHQVNQLYHNLGNGRFEEVTASAGEVFKLSEVSRGAAFGDLDNDGDTDVVVSNDNGPVRLLINQTGNRRPWIGLRMTGGKGGGDVYGTRVEVFRDAGPPLWQHVHTDGSYGSASDPRLLFGLGEAKAVARVRAIWPDGRVEEWTGLALGAYTTLREGTGKPVPAAAGDAGKG